MQSNPLDGLHDVIVPTTAAWWPLAPIWWLLIVLLCVAIAVAVSLFIKARKYSKAKRQAVNLSHMVNHDAAQLHIILKRLTRHYYSEKLASQSTAKWSTSLGQLTGLTFSEAELLALYHTPNDNPALAKKLQQAILCFKLKESIDV
ncbi:DUF4381 domain-containing protein [Pseudoalteromonas mariniglutinosa]|uniref:DUF4381 domain-containing protein n=1 Tax=Pseudoalteromonas mariniglutinosa TaxID=206042 RepID=UPI00384F0A45